MCGLQFSSTRSQEKSSHPPSLLSEIKNQPPTSAVRGQGPLVSGLSSLALLS